MPLRQAGDFPVYLIRHGETEFNVERRLQGRNDSPLTARGREQARGIAGILSGIVSRDDLPHFVASPLGRARATMEIILDGLGLSSSLYAIDENLAEIDTGVWSGMLGPEIRETDGARFEARLEDKWNIPCPGGESFAMVAERAGTWLASLTRPTVAVSHGTFGRVLRSQFLDCPYESLDEPQDCVFRLHMGTIARLERE